MVFNRKIFLKEVVSSSDYLIKLNKETDLEEGLVVVSDFQTRGRGRSENSWLSDSGKNLLFSFILKPSFLPVQKQFFLSAISSISMVYTLKKYINEKINIKWPNDIIVDQKKIAGFLLDLSISSKTINMCVIGLGLNVHQDFFPGLNNATSMCVFNKSIPENTVILNDFLHHFSKLYKDLKNGNFEEIKNIYLSITADFKSISLINGIKSEIQILNILEDGVVLGLVNGVEKELKHVF